MVYWSCRLKDGVKVLSALQVVMLPLTYASEEVKHFASPDARAEGGCFMTFERVVLLLAPPGGAIYATFEEITWTISNGKRNDRPSVPILSGHFF